MKHSASGIFICFLLLHNALNAQHGANPGENGLPSHFDWRDQNIMTPVKHQMNLGSCGVFAAVAVFESLIRMKTGRDVDLSEQQIINCSVDWVPSGISSVDAMKFMTENGIVSELDLPYEDRQTSKKPDHPYDYKLKEYRTVVTHNMPLTEKIASIKRAVYRHGPIATNMLFYSDLDRYEKGIYEYDGESTEEGGHWIVVIGWCDDDEVKNEGYWICRNSWGPDWGEDGYFRIPYGECGVDDFWYVYGVY
ncbi:MAG: hypothetical protein JW861_05665 [Bacteroidales bacterium]|nr:hypothetical protein [Bacteroidales bacterium]